MGSNGPDAELCIPSGSEPYHETFSGRFRAHLNPDGLSGLPFNAAGYCQVFLPVLLGPIL